MAVTWKDWDAAVISGHIKYLYEIECTGKIVDTFMRYCTGRENIVYDGNEYVAKPIKHGKITFDSTKGKASIVLPGSVLLIELFIKNIAPKTKLTIYRWREELDEAIVIFKGVLLKANFADSLMSLSFGSAMEGVDDNTLTYFTQRYCNHAMYDQRCGLDFETMRIQVDDWQLKIHNRIIFGGTFDIDKEYLKCALLFYTIRVFDNDQEYLIEQSVTIAEWIGSTREARLRFPIPESVALDQPMYLAPNCLLDLDRCNNIFANVHRACAWPDMPRTNYAAVDVANLNRDAECNIGFPVHKQDEMQDVQEDLSTYLKITDYTDIEIEGWEPPDYS